MAQSVVLSIDVCRGLGISPLRINIWLSFSPADLGPRLAQEFFCSFFFKINVFSKVGAHSEPYMNLLAGIFEIRTFLGQHRVSIVNGLNVTKLDRFAFTGSGANLKSHEQRHSRKKQCVHKLNVMKLYSRSRELENGRIS